MANHLDSIYRRGSPIVFEPNDDALMMKSYLDHLRRGPRSGSSYLPFANRNELVLSRCDVDSSWLIDSLASKRNWDSIDVSFTKVDDDAWVKQGVDWDIVRLNVESTKVTDRSIASFAKMPRVQELDLSNCKITDQGVASLQNQKTLKTLWLAGTSITDQSIAVLATLPRLEAIHLEGTSVSPDGWQQLLKAIPRIRSKSTGPK
jgi:Leucine-rich repeat (LRR) protein